MLGSSNRRWRPPHTPCPTPSLLPLAPRMSTQVWGSESGTCPLDPIQYFHGFLKPFQLPILIFRVIHDGHSTSAPTLAPLQWAEGPGGSEKVNLNDPILCDCGQHVIRTGLEAPTGVGGHPTHPALPLHSYPWLHGCPHKCEDERVERAPLTLYNISMVS